jgi:hypothetical protein
MLAVTPQITGWDHLIHHRGREVNDISINIFRLLKGINGG